MEGGGRGGGGDYRGGRWSRGWMVREIMIHVSHNYSSRS